MLSEFARRTIESPMRLLIKTVGSAEAVDISPVEAVNIAIECALQAGKQDVAENIANNRKEAEQIISGLLGLM